MVEADVPSDDSQSRTGSEASDSADSSFEIQPLSEGNADVNNARGAQGPNSRKATEETAEQDRYAKHQRSIKLRRKNDTFYDDYLHRGSHP